MILKREWTDHPFAPLETLFHNANGYLGVRNSPEEGNIPDSIRGTYINGFYETVPIAYEEKLHGFTEEKQTLVNVQDAQTIRIFTQYGSFSMFSPDTTEREQVLNSDSGLTHRSCLWKTQDGNLRIKFTRMVSFRRPNTFLIHCEVLSESFHGKLHLSSLLNGEVYNHAQAGDPRAAAQPLKCLQTISKGWNGKIAEWTSRTLRSDLTVSCHMAHQCNSPLVYREENDLLSADTEVLLSPGEEFSLVKYVVYTDSLRDPDCVSTGNELIHKIASLPLNLILKEQAVYLYHWKNNCCIRLLAPSPMPETMEYDLYELLQSTGWDGFCNVAAKGISGEGYEGHVFWDSEIYVFPYFLWTQPEKARGMLLYRCRMLDSARKHARELGIENGAVYPWRTISGGECSAYYPSGSAQYHINGDIAYAIMQYWYVTDDLDFMAEYGAEVLIETSRAWIELGHLESDGFRIDCVTGPDEYTCCVNNNFYTNAVAQNNMRGAVQVYRELKKQNRLATLLQKTKVTETEIDNFERCAEQMYFPTCEKLGISPQDDSFLSKKKLDLSQIPRENYPLLMHYHPLFLYRHQVCKQADTVLAHLLFPHTADQETIRRSWEYYNQIDTHDSSLSVCIYATAAARLGMSEQALKGFEATATLDLFDTHGNTRDGLHTASLGGAFMAILRGFAGVTADRDHLSCDPVLPDEWEGYDIPLMYHGIRYVLKVRLNESPELIPLENND